MAFLFEKLEVCQKAVDFGDRIVALTENFPRGYGFLDDQLSRAALSIATNLAEGNAASPRPTVRTSSPSPGVQSRSASPCSKWRAGGTS